MNTMQQIEKKNQLKEKQIENVDEMRKIFGVQLTNYLGSTDKVRVFAKECRDVGLDLGDPRVIKQAAAEPEWFQVLLSYSELGLLPRLGNAVTKMKKGIENGN